MSRRKDPQNAAAEITSIRERIHFLKEESRTVADAPISHDEIRARVDRLVADAAYFASERVPLATLNTEWGSKHLSDAQAALSELKPFDLLALVAPEQLKAGLQLRLVAESETFGSAPLSAEVRASRLNNLNKELFLHEILEERLIRSDESAQIERRGNASPMVVLATDECLFSDE